MKKQITFAILVCLSLAIAIPIVAAQDISIVLMNSTSGGHTDPPVTTYVHPIGTPLTLTAYPDTGYYFKGWKFDNSENLVLENPVNIQTIAGTHSYQAIFERATGSTPTPHPNPIQDLQQQYDLKWIFPIIAGVAALLLIWQKKGRGKKQ